MTCELGLRHFASPSFWEAYAKLPENVRALADKNYALLKADNASNSREHHEAPLGNW